jgi:hypothetical protein
MVPVWRHVDKRGMTHVILKSQRPSPGRTRVVAADQLAGSAAAHLGA